MKSNRIFSALRSYTLPVLLVLMGLVLIILPDSASILISGIIAWVLAMAGLCYLVFSFASRRRTRNVITGMFCLILGVFLVKNPLFLARNLGRVLGVLLAVEGIDNLSKGAAGKTMGLLTLLGAGLLLTAPMAASRMVFTLCGVLLAALGAGQILMQLRRKSHSEEDDDPNIIDAL